MVFELKDLPGKSYQRPEEGNLPMNADAMGMSNLLAFVESNTVEEAKSAFRRGEVESINDTVDSARSKFRHMEVETTNDTVQRAQSSFHADEAQTINTYERLRRQALALTDEQIFELHRLPTENSGDSSDYVWQRNPFTDRLQRVKVEPGAMERMMRREWEEPLSAALAEQKKKEPTAAEMLKARQELPPLELF